MSDKKKLILLDGHALAFRAYHALPAGMATSHGEPTNAVYGFTSMLLNTLQEEQPDYIAVAFDVGRTFRHDAFPEYKANRVAMPAELRSQLERIRQIVAAFNIPIFEVEGYEADDVLGALARQAEIRGVDTLIVTGDTDTFQLVGPHVRVLTSRRQFSDTVIYDEARIKERYGLKPRQLVDLKGLTGDTSDNIPGVPGIGEKTAIPLLQQFGTVEAIYEHLDEITNKRARRALEAGRESAFLSKKLATITTEVPVGLDLEACRTTHYDAQKVRALFWELEFRSLFDRLPEPPKVGAQLSLLDQKAEGVPPGDAGGVQIVDSEAALNRLAGRLAQAPTFAFDVETTAIDPVLADLVGIAVALGPAEACYIPVGHQEGRRQLRIERVLAGLKSALEGPGLKYLHNGKYDLAVLARHGATLAGPLFDTMVAAWVLEPARRGFGLKDLAWARFNVDMQPISDLIGKGQKQITMAQVPVESAANYAAADVTMTWRLAEALAADLKEHGLWDLFQHVEMPLVPILTEMELMGVHLDVDYLQQISRELAQRIAELESDIYGQVGFPFNVNSTKQLGDVLFRHLGLPVLKRTKTGPSTDASVLEALQGQHPVIDLLLEYRQLSKLKSTYVDALPLLVNRRTGRVHTSYNQTGTVTGRLSSSDPNLQNIPIRTEEGRRIRRAFAAEDGRVLVAADYSQVELRILAHVTGDEGLLSAFRRGEDIHASTASTIFGVPLSAVTPEMRRVAKMINFGLSYGMSGYGLAQRTGLPQEEADRFIKSYFASYPGVAGYMDRTVRQARQQGYVETLLGRRRYFPEFKSTSRAATVQQRAAEREAINMPIQGCLPYETRVLTSDGYRQIGELYRSDCTNLRVWTGTAFAPFRVINRGPCELAELVLENGHVLRCDTRHEVLVVTEEGYVWKNYQHLVEGDRICLTLPQEIEFGSSPAVDYEYTPGVHSGKALSLSTLDESFFYWLGFYYGDGWLYHNPDNYLWSLAYCFGAKAGYFEASDKAMECARYFEGLGLNADIRSASSNKVELIIHSRGFIELLEQMGVATEASAATKRVPDFVLCRPLLMRKAFLRGILDSDGYAGGEGATNPNIRLCQRPLLEDLWLLFRTVGVEGKLRGPYRYRDHISYRLDLVGGMLERSLGFSGRSIIKVPNMAAPDFIVASFLENVSPSQLSKHSHKVIYSRIRHGGKTSIYTLAEMVKAAGASLPMPLYTWSALLEKRSFGAVEETFTLMVDDPLHRFDSEGVISKNTAADIIKIAMIRLHQALKKEGLDSRMTIQVHDELVLEVPKEEVAVVARLVRQAMEGAFELVIPLKVEVKVGENWDEMEEVKA